MKNLQYEGTLDPRVEGFMEKVNGKMGEKNIVYEQTESGVVNDDILTILEELDKIRRLLKNVKREVRSVVQEELDILMSEASLITEGAADELTIMIGNTKFKGKIRIVK